MTDGEKKTCMQCELWKSCPRYVSSPDPSVQECSARSLLRVARKTAADDQKRLMLLQEDFENEHELAKKAGEELSKWKAAANGYLKQKEEWRADYDRAEGDRLEACKRRHTAEVQNAELRGALDKVTEKVEGIADLDNHQRAERLADILWIVSNLTPQPKKEECQCGGSGEVAHEIDYEHSTEVITVPCPKCGGNDVSKR